MDFHNKFIFNFLIANQGASPLQLSDFADISQVVIALVNIYLVFYIFRFENKNRKKAKIEEIVKNSNSVKLQGFKDFIVAPNFIHLQNFFSNLLKLKQKINSPQISDVLSIELNDYIKSEVSNFRLNFNDAILNVNRELFNVIKLKIENLSDHLIITISDDTYDLTNPDLFEAHISTPINYAKNEIVALLISYTGD